jgi:hypothetical protein
MDRSEVELTTVAKEIEKVFGFGSFRWRGNRRGWDFFDWSGLLSFLRGDRRAVYCNSLSKFTLGPWSCQPDEYLKYNTGISIP